MTKLYLDGKEKRYNDWTLWMDKDTDKIFITLLFASGKKFTRELGDWTIEPCHTILGNVLFDKSKHVTSMIEKAIQVGDEYVIVTYSDGNKEYIYKSSEVSISEAIPFEKYGIFDYFKEIAKERVSDAKKDEVGIAKNVLQQFDKLVANNKSSLASYLKNEVHTLDGLKHYIFPFGVNESQLRAVENAFSSQISIIEGPPGTGKTQTTLNIIANILVNGKTCAIVSNNNTAVENVYEKLHKVKLDFMIAKLGKSDNKKLFFEEITYKKPEFEDSNIELNDIDNVFNKLSNLLRSRNDLASIENEIQEIKIEMSYLNDWIQSSGDLDLMKFKYSNSSMKLINCLVYTRSLHEKPLRFINKLNFVFRYRMFNNKILDKQEDRQIFIFHLQKSYYESLLSEKNIQRKHIEKLLNNANFDGLLSNLKEMSLLYMYKYIKENMPNSTDKFTEKNYMHDKFKKFINCFPIFGSSTHSLVNSIPKGFMFDYVIIDEASQQDIVPGVLCLGCANNVVVVGDRKQLPHIPKKSNLAVENDLYNCSTYSLLDSISELYTKKIPFTLLKEHYRCHPKIIQFCNMYFYNNQLISMKSDKGENSLTLITTAKGNHRRNNSNLREIESIIKLNKCSEFQESTGFIAPFNDQVRLSENLLPNEVVKETIHKFQGRECDRIIFSTVLDKKKSGRYLIKFVDDAALINVAVSRAKQEFILVTGDDVFAENNKHIAALIRYIKYYAHSDEIFESPVISAFDLLYADYDKSLEKLHSKLNKSDSKYKSEQIVSAVLREIMADHRFENLIYHSQIYLRQLVSQINNNFTERELSFLKNGACCDYVLYYIDKTPFAVIEVDGEHHSKAVQKERDAVKDSILGKASIPILRLKTINSEIEEIIINFILECLKMEYKD